MQDKSNGLLCNVHRENENIIFTVRFLCLKLKKNQEMELRRL